MSFFNKVIVGNKYGKETRVIATQAQLTTSQQRHLNSGKFIPPTHKVKTK